MATPFLLHPAQAATFRAERHQKIDLVRGAGIFLGLNCFEPGQGQRIHAHDGADKFYLILSGKASMVVGEDRFDAGPGDLVWAPANVMHGVAAALERTVMLIGLTPPDQA